jgi:hypothetical protein
LREFTIPRNVQFIGDSESEDGDAIINSASVFRGQGQLIAINVALENEWFTSVDGVLYDKEKTTLLVYPIGKHGTSYTVADSVTVIARQAFSNSTLTEIILPNGVEEIGDSSFQNTQLESITIPDSVTSIGINVFSNSDSLIEVVFKGVTYAPEDLEVLFGIINEG